MVAFSEAGRSSLRWWTYAKRRRLCCAKGHHLPANTRIPESGFIRCQHWVGDADRRQHGDAPRTGQECGRWVFVYVVRGGRCVIVEVQAEEQDEMEELQTPAEMLDFLGIFPGGSCDHPSR